MKITEKIFKQSLWLIVVTICGIGFIVQVSHVSNRYFRYHTRTVVDMIIPTKLESFPSMSTCWDMNRLINRTWIKKYYPEFLIDPNNKSSTDSSDMKKIRDLPIKDLFKGTPTTSQILDLSPGCLIRFSDKFIPESYPGPECQSYFKIFQYFEREYVCYKFVPENNTSFLRMIRYTMGPSYSGEMFQLNLDNEIFKNVGAISISVHTNGSSKLYDSVFASNHYFSDDKYPGLRVSYREVKRTLLKAPYGRGCLDAPKNYSTGSEYYIYQLNEYLSHNYGFISPFAPIYNHSSRYKVLHHESFKHKNISDLVITIMEKQSKYKHTCTIKFVDTTAELLNVDKSYVALYWPQNEMLSLMYVPDQELIDYVVYIGSCIGIWFGLSAYSFHDLITLLVIFKSKYSNKITPISADNLFEKRNRRETTINVFNQIRPCLVSINSQIDAITRRNKIVSELLDIKVIPNIARIEKDQSHLMVKIGNVEELLQDLLQKQT